MRLSTLLAAWLWYFSSDQGAAHHL